MSKPDVIMAVMKLSRAMRRGPMHPGPGGMPPAGGGRMLSVMHENPNVTSRELAELLDIRPSSLTELLGRLEKEELITRTADDSDKRVSRVSLTEKGEQTEAAFAEAHAARLEKFAACFTDEEAEQFCEMCSRLSAHLESLAAEKFGENGGCPPEHDRCRGRHGHCGGRHGHHGRPPFGEPPFGEPPFGRPPFGRPPFEGDEAPDPDED